MSLLFLLLASMHVETVKTPSAGFGPGEYTAGVVRPLGDSRRCLRARRLLFRLLSVLLLQFLWSEGPVLSRTVLLGTLPIMKAPTWHATTALGSRLGLRLWGRTFRRVVERATLS